MTPHVSSFRNEELLNLNDHDIRTSLQAALASLDSSGPVQVPVVIGGEARDIRDWFASNDPATWTRVVAGAESADVNAVSEAVDVADAASEGWAARTQEERSEILRTAARLLRGRRLEALALLVRECGKTWVEADAEYCEAVDFLEYYASAALDLGGRDQLLQAAGERNSLVHCPRGVAGVIIPWNFPIAIGLGMVAGPLVMGNTALIKPAEQTPATGLFIHTLLRDAGVPADVVALLPGAGDTGAAVVEHPLVDTLLFTGSRAVGLSVIEKAARTGLGQRQIKKVIAEMGGKNCIIVDASADLDSAVQPIIRSAFAFGGQKCSAASRVLAHRSIVDELTDRLAAAVEDLAVGYGEDFNTDVTALIEPAAQLRVAALVEQAVSEGILVARAADVPDGGCFVAPTIVRDLPATSPLLIEEAFGPLLTVETFDDLDDALRRVDGLPYALTGGVFAQSPDVLAEVIRRSPVGNLYVNRKITGALVGRQPFGGNRMSGIGIKAGSADYLTQFVHQKVVCEQEAAG